MRRERNPESAVHITEPSIQHSAPGIHHRASQLDVEELNEFVHLTFGQHRKADSFLENVLECKGIDLAMASTILRFRNPNVFQIIDKRAYRAVYGKNTPCIQAALLRRKLKHILIISIV